MDIDVTTLDVASGKLLRRFRESSDIGYTDCSIDLLHVSIVWDTWIAC